MRWRVSDEVPCLTSRRRIPCRRRASLAGSRASDDRAETKLLKTQLAAKARDLNAARDAVNRADAARAELARGRDRSGKDRRIWRRSQRAKWLHRPAGLVAHGIHGARIGCRIIVSPVGQAMAYRVASQFGRGDCSARYINSLSVNSCKGCMKLGWGSVGSILRRRSKDANMKRSDVVALVSLLSAGLISLLFWWWYHGHWGWSVVLGLIIFSIFNFAGLAMLTLIRAADR